jgi:FKBP-type peptidyl-prolyl cis-trans isomerase
VTIRPIVGPAFALLPIVLAALPGCRSASVVTASVETAGNDAGAAELASTAGADASLAPPPDVAASPEDALTTSSGLSTKVLAPGTGTVHPGINDAVRVTYAGWTADGTLFTRGEAEPAYVNRAIRGWTEALQLMTPGEKRRLWVPEALAYKGAPGTPRGTLVFDVALLDILPGPAAPADVEGPGAGAISSPHGLASKVLRPGTGTAHPRPDDGVRVRYSVWRRSGVLSDSSRGLVVVRPMSGDFPGWNEGVSLMVPGEVRILWIPSSLGPGPRGLPGSRPDPNLTALIELVEILSPPAAPADLRRRPRSALVAHDGLASRVLTKGTGTVHPTVTDNVTVRFAAWTADGKTIGSSYTMGEPATVPVVGDMRGWDEALQLMVTGEKRRVWIPKGLAYEGKPQRPQGDLVFDIELEGITPDEP